MINIIEMKLHNNSLPAISWLTMKIEAFSEDEEQTAVQVELFQLLFFSFGQKKALASYPFTDEDREEFLWDLSFLSSVTATGGLGLGI